MPALSLRASIPRRRIACHSSDTAGLVSYQSLGISIEDEFELRHEPAYRTRTGWMPLISHDIGTLKIPEFLDMVAEIQTLRAWLSMTLRARFGKCALMDHSVGKTIAALDYHSG